jgi:cell division transport system permease protein
MPFLLQGVVLGGLGGISATLILTRAYTVFVKHINRLLPFLMVPEGGTEIFIQLVLLLVGGGMALGWICSWIATSRHIRDALRPL